MKKDRNSFFSEYGFNQSTGYIPNMNMNQMGMVPNQTVSANSQFYAGPSLNNNNAFMNQNMYSDIDARMAKIEREINRLESRVSRLEEGGKSSGDEVNYNTNMYMV